MNLSKELSMLNKVLNEMQTCKNAERFYELCTTLYFHINCVVFNFQHCNIGIKDSCNKNTTNENKYNFDNFLRLDNE